MDISFLDKQDTYSVLLSAVYASEADEGYRFLSDIMLALDTDSFKKFISLFEGQTIKVPTIDKLVSMIQAMLVYAYHDVEKMNMRDAAEKAGITYSTSVKKMALDEYKRFKQLLKERKVEIGGVMDGFPTPKSQIIQ